MKHDVIFNRHVDFAQKCLKTHQPNKPFHFTLKTYFKTNKKFGSRDRKRIKALCYSWYRLGYSFESLSRNKQIVLAYAVLINPQEDWFAEYINESFDLSENWSSLSLSERLEKVGDVCKWDITSCFPRLNEVTEGVDRNRFLMDQLEQPKLWMRQRNEVDRSSLEEEVGDVEFTKEGAIGLEIGVQLDQIKSLRGKVVVQDLSSQIALDTLADLDFETVWDCCCASGGKSLNLLDNRKKIKVFASDVRESVLNNFGIRTKRYKHRVWNAIIDLKNAQTSLVFNGSSGTKKFENESLDLVLADVPCSGSGTWSRNPEFKYFVRDHLGEYQALQLSIIKNAWPFIKKEGLLLYTTCSVYTQENEDVLDQFSSEKSLDIVKKGYIYGYENRSDTMFYALLRKK